MDRLAPPRHDALDDILDPAETPNLFGHGELFEQFAASYDTGRLHHAQLLLGRRGIGKATFAYRFARHLVDPDWQPGDATFRQIASGASASVLPMSRPYNEKTKSFRQAITVAEVRRISHFLTHTNGEGRWRIVIVDPIDDLNVQAANALLKNLEEPPPRTIFLLIAHSLGRVLPTIRSRAQRNRLEPLAPQTLRKTLDSLAVPLPDDGGQANRLIERAGGSVRDAILLSQFGGIEVEEAIDDLVGGTSWNVSLADRLANAVRSRDSALALDQFHDIILDRVAGAARQAALDGDTPRGARLAELHGEFAVNIGEAMTFNLDRRQHAITMLRRLQQALAR